MTYAENLSTILDIAILFIFIAIFLLLRDSKKRSERMDKLFERLNEIKTD